MEFTTPADFVSLVADAASASPKRMLPKHPDDQPFHRLLESLRSVDAGLRSESLLALISSLDGASTTYLRHAIEALAHADSPDVLDSLAKALTPLPAWLSGSRDNSLASELLVCLAQCGRDHERLLQVWFELSALPENRRHRLWHLVTFFAPTHGIQEIRQHLDAHGALKPSDGWRLGGRFARDAPEYLAELAGRLRAYPADLREQFFEGASPRLAEDEQKTLRAQLGLAGSS